MILDTENVLESGEVLSKKRTLTQDIEISEENPELVVCEMTLTKEWYPSLYHLPYFK